MSNSPNKGIPYVPENTLDPAAGLNDAINVLDATDSVVGVISMGLTVPPGSNSDGDLYVVAPGGTGDWEDLDNHLVRFVAEGSFWQSYVPGSQITLVYNRADGYLYRYDEANLSPPAWVIAAGIFDAPSDGVRYARRDAAWEAFEFPVRAERVTWVSPSPDVELVNTVNRVDLVIPYAGTVVGAVVTSLGGPGSAVIDIWKDTYANWPPDVDDSILASAKITLSTESKYQNNDPAGTGWETAIAAGDILRFNLESVDVFTALFITLLIRPS
jgi:hypothetical protein